MTPELAARERQILFSLVVGTTQRTTGLGGTGATARLIEFGLVKADARGALSATDAGRQWLRALLKGGPRGSN